ncbi:MAG: glycosyltransferase [Galbitalea sp.]
MAALCAAVRIQANSARILREVKPDVVHFQSNIVVGRGMSKQALKHKIRLIATNHVMPENLLEFSLVPRFAWPMVVKWLWWDANRIYGTRGGDDESDPVVPRISSRRTRRSAGFSRSPVGWMRASTRRTSNRAPRTSSCSSAGSRVRSRSTS